MIVDFTSAETTTVINWIESDEQRRRYWLALAASALVRNERTAAIPKISAALYEAVAETLPVVEGLAACRFATQLDIRTAKDPPSASVERHL